MICPKCGTQNADGARFCGKCGEPLNSAAKFANMKGPRDSRNSGSSLVNDALGFLKSNSKLVSIIAGALVVILLFTMLFGGRGYKKTVNKFMDSLLDMDAKGMVEMLPDKVVKAALEEEGYSKKEFIQELQSELDYSMGYMDMLGDMKIKHKVVGAEALSKEDLAYLKDMYSEFGIKVSAAKEVEVEMTIKALGMTQSETFELVVIKIGRSWYIDVESMGSIL